MEQTKQERKKLNCDLINVAHVKKFALRYAQDNRLGWMPQRVSGLFLEDLNTKVRLTITKAIMHHATLGITIKDLL